MRQLFQDILATLEKGTGELIRIRALREGRRK